MTPRTLLAVRMALVAWWAAMAVGSHWPNIAQDIRELGIDQGAFPLLNFDKWLHIFCYAVLSGLALLATPRLRPVAVLGLLLIYASADETSQQWVTGRTVSIHDWYASVTGLALGAGAWWAGRRLSDHDGSFVAHSRLVSVLTLISRFFGLARDWTLAFAFGLGFMMDAFVVAFMIPNLFRRLFGEGALAAAFLPQYAKLKERDGPEAMAFGRSVLWRLGLGLAALTALAVIALAIWLATGTLGERGVLTAELTMILLWFAPLICVTALAGSILQSHGRFGPPAAAPIFLNVAIIFAAFYAAFGLPENTAAFGRLAFVGVAILAAGAGQLLWHLALLPNRSGQGDPAVVQEARRVTTSKWLPTVFGLAVFQINVLIDAMIAMFFSGAPGSVFQLGGFAAPYPLDVGDVAVLGFAQRLYEFPLGVFGIAIATAIFPALAASASDPDRFANLVRQGLRLTVFIGLPASLGLLLVREPLTRAIFYPAGNLESGDAARIAWVLAGYAPAVWAYSMNHVLTRAFYAREDPVTPVRVSMAMVVLNVGLNLVLIWPLGAAGLAMSTAVCAILQAAILLAKVRRFADTPFDRDVAVSWCRTAAFSAAMGLAVWGFVRSFAVDTLSRGETLGLLAAAVALGGATVLAGAMLLRAPEWRWLLKGKL